MRAGLRSLIGNQPDMEVIGEAATGDAAIGMAQSLRPDVVLMDLRMPRMNGLEAARQVVRETPGVGVIALAADLTGPTIRQGKDAGIRSFVLKEAVFDDLIEAIRVTHRGEEYFCTYTRGLMARTWAGSLRADQAAAESLSREEQELVQLLAEGKTVGQIALRLNRSPKTIDARRRRTMNKLGISSVADLTKFAIRHGLTTVNS